MIRFKEYLKEKLVKIGFENGYDYDNPGKSDLVLVVDRTHVYKIEGKTHGMASHALKHLASFYPNEVDSYLEEAINILRNSQDELYVKNFKNNTIIAEGVEVFKYISDKSIVLNTLDYINDRKWLRKKLLRIEHTIEERILSKFKRLYQSMIMKYMAKAEDLETATSKKCCVKFVADNWRYSPQTWYYDINDRIIIHSRKRVQSLYRTNNILGLIKDKLRNADEIIDKLTKLM